jgi:hypothetical protein
MTLLTIMVDIFCGFKTGFSGLPGTGLSRPYPANGIAEIRRDRSQSWSRGFSGIRRAVNRSPLSQNCIELQERFSVRRQF